MPLGVDVTTSLAPPSEGGSTDTETLFVAAATAAGPTDEATEIHSVADFTNAGYGARGAATVDWDGLDAFFREGGRRAFVGRYDEADGGTLADALALFPEDAGPGQLVAWDEPHTEATAALLLASAAATDRFALIDEDEDFTLAEREALGDAVRADANVTHGMLAGQPVTVPGPSGILGVGPRTVPGSAITAALIARADALGNPNRAAAGRDFPLQYATGFASRYGLADVDAALGHGVNTFMDRFGVLQLYGFQSAVEQDPDNPFWQANVGRLRMAASARAKVIGENYMFKPLTPGLMNGFKSDLEAMLKVLFEANALLGATPRDAYSVSVSAVLNPDSNIAQGEMRAQAEFRPSTHVKHVAVDLATVPVTGRIAA
jgi:hypothetical protein